MEYRFIVASDMHYGLGDYQARTDLLLTNLNKEKETGLDFLVLNGDIVHSSSEDYSDPEEMLRYVIPNIYEPLNVPLYTTAGNHDRINTETWKEITGHNRSHTFEWGDIGFIVLDTSDVSGSRQICIDKEFLAKSVDKFKHKKGVVLVSHIPRHRGQFLQPSVDSPHCTEILKTLRNCENLLFMTHGHMHGQHGKFMRFGVPLFFDGHITTYGTVGENTFYSYRIYEVYKNHVVTKLWNMTDEKVENRDIIRFPPSRKTDSSKFKSIFKF